MTTCTLAFASEHQAITHTSNDSSALTILIKPSFLNNGMSPPTKNIYIRATNALRILSVYNLS